MGWAGAQPNDWTRSSWPSCTGGRTSPPHRGAAHRRLAHRRGPDADVPGQAVPGVAPAGLRHRPRPLPAAHPGQHASVVVADAVAAGGAHRPHPRPGARGRRPGPPRPGRDGAPGARPPAPRQRAALALRYYADLPEAEVADLLGCSVGTVKAHTHRGIQRLRSCWASSSSRPGPKPC